MTLPEPNDRRTFKLSSWGWQLLVIGLFWASLTGIFLTLPKKSLLNLIIAISIVILYAGGICRFRRSMMWIAIGITIMINLVNAIINPGAPIVNYVVAMTISINFLLFGELGIQLLKNLSRQQTFFRLTGLFAGALSFGWIVGVIFGYTPP